MTDVRHLPVVRAIVVLGWTGLARYVAVVSVGFWLVVALTIWRPDLRQPGDIGTDASNYYAAGLRVAAGADVYALGVGDRPVPADDPPRWTVPLLSPPPVAVLWAPIALALPGAPAMYLWWLGGAAGAVMCILFALGLSGRWALAGLGMTIVMMPLVALTTVSGNINAWLIPAFLAVFAMSDRSTKRGATIAMALIVGTAAAMKLGPVLLIWWLVIRRRTRAAIGAVVVVAAWTGLSALVAGPGVYRDYIAISQATAQGGATPISAASLARGLGIPDSLAAAAPLLVLATTAAGALAVRGRPVIASGLIVVGSIFATPVVRTESFALLAATVGYAAVRSGPVPLRWVPPRPLIAAAGLLVGLGVAAWIAAAPSSSIVIANRTSHDLTVRFGATAQTATFGFRVSPASRVRATALIPGALDGSVIVYGPGCAVLSMVSPVASGGLLTIDEMSIPTWTRDPGSGEADAPFVADCAGR